MATDDLRQKKSWEVDTQPRLIRLYMTGMSFPEIESAMSQDLAGRKSSSSERPRILAKPNGYKTYSNRFRDWGFPIDLTERKKQD
jgi:hypothetical protein